MSITDHKPMPEGEFVRARRVEVFTGADPPILDGRREVGDCRGEFCVELERKPGSATATTNALAMFIWRREARLQSSEADIQGSCQRSLTGQMQLSDLLSSNRILAATACGSGVVRSRPASGRLCLRARPHDVVADRAPCRIQGRPSGRRLRRISGAGGQGRKPYLVGWRGYFGFCQTPRVLTNLEAWIRRRLRLYLWRQWRLLRSPSAGRICAAASTNAPSPKPPRSRAKRCNASPRSIGSALRRSAEFGNDAVGDHPFAGARGVVPFASEGHGREPDRL